MIGKVRFTTLCNRCNAPVEPGAELQRSGEYARLCRACEAELRARPGGPAKEGA